MPKQPSISSRQSAEPQMLGSPLPMPMPMPPPQAVGQAAGPADPPADGRRPAGGFLGRPWVQDALPFVTSLVGHAAVIVLLLVTIKVVETVARDPKDKPEEQTTIATAQPIAKSSDTPGGVLFQGPSNLPFDHPRTEQAEAVNTTGYALSKQPEVDPGATGDPSEHAAPGSKTIGGRSAALASVGGGANGSGIFGEGPGGGPLAGFGPTRTGGASGPKNVVFGNGGPNARKIVFICDATGTMISKLPILKQELIKTVSELKSGVQSYNIVFFHDGGKVLAADAGGLLVCNTDNLRKTMNWLDDVTPAGTTDPIPAIERAFAMQPDLVYFLSDGEFNNIRTYEQVIAAVGKANAGKRARVNTILFETRDPEAERAMDAIAAQNGGKYTFVKEEDINRAGGR